MRLASSRYRGIHKELSKPNIFLTTGINDLYLIGYKTNEKYYFECLVKWG